MADLRGEGRDGVEYGPARAYLRAVGVSLDERVDLQDDGVLGRPRIVVRQLDAARLARHVHAHPASFDVTRRVLAGRSGRHVARHQHHDCESHLQFGILNQIRQDLATFSKI